MIYSFDNFVKIDTFVDVDFKSVLWNTKYIRIWSNSFNS